MQEYKESNIGKEILQRVLAALVTNCQKEADDFPTPEFNALVNDTKNKQYRKKTLGTPAMEKI